MQYPITYWEGIKKEFIYRADGSFATEEIDRVKDAGFTLMLAEFDAKTNLLVLDAAHERGMKVMVSDGDIYRAIANPEQRRAYLAGVVEKYGAHPALFGYHIVDEPNASAFDMLAEIREILAELDPAHEAYINLFPNYASPEQLGNPTYEDHLAQYTDMVKPSIISYDHYHFLKGARKQAKIITNEREQQIYDSTFGGASEFENVDRAGFFTNIEQIRNESLKTGIPFMVIILVVEHGPYRNLTDGELRWEVWQSLAYGSARLSYFTYWTPGANNTEGDDFWHWQNGMISQTGETLPHYHMIADINRELQAVGSILNEQQSLGVYHLGEMPNERYVQYLQGAAGPIDSVQGDKLTVGVFTDGYVLIANRDYENENDFCFKAEGTVALFDAESGEFLTLESEDGIYRMTLGEGDAILLKFEN
ncbi:MAG: hypothetical protein IJW70_00690 [Clostridia bacterium]|nr:hypothetical protein [Clostridia bacterium]